MIFSLCKSSHNRIYIDSYIDSENSVDNKKNNKRDYGRDKKFDSKPEYYYNNPIGKAVGDLVSTPLKWFEDKYDESGNRVEKRRGSPTEKEQPTDWLNQLSPTYKKKVRENIERIKKIL